MNLIGNKREFAVEYQITDIEKMMGYGKLWIQNKFYGSNQDLIYLKGYLVKLIENILDAKPLKLNLDISNKDETYEHLKKTSDESSIYQIFGSTFTDDFIGYKFRDENKIILVWKIREDVEMIFSDLMDYPKSTNLEKVNYYVVKEVLNKLNDEIKRREHNK